MEPWMTVSLFGLAVFGLAWLTPASAREEDAGSDPAYDRLLEELETENRELLEAVSKFKQEQDETVKRLVSQIEDLERKFQTTVVAAAAAADAAGSSAAVAAISGWKDARTLPADEQVNVSEYADPGSPASEMEAGIARTEAGLRADEPAAAKAEAESASIRVRYAQLLELHAKGKSVEQIAKSAGMNKGEVQLILHLAKREAEQLA